MNACAIWCLVLCCFLAQSADALGNDQPIDPCKPAEAKDQPKPPAEEKEPVPPAKKRPKKLLRAKKRPDIVTNEPRGFAGHAAPAPFVCYAAAPSTLDAFWMNLLRLVTIRPFRPIDGWS